jgi:cation transport ATPase
MYRSQVLNLIDDPAAWDAQTKTALLTMPGITRGELLALAGAVEHASEHPVAAAITAAARSGGPNEATARSVAAAAGIDEVVSGTMPDQKARVIAGLEASGCSVAMVGDGDERRGSCRSPAGAGAGFWHRCRDLRGGHDRAAR